MKVAIMQPYFFPYIGHFSLIAATEKWVVFDTAQFQRHGWMDRNRILHPTEGWQYIKVPLVKHPQNIPANEIETKSPSDWQSKILRQLEHYKKRAPFYKSTIDLLEEAFACKSAFLWEHNLHYLKACCAYLQITFNFSVFSKLDLDLGPCDTGEWALEISKRMGATEYINPHGGVELFDPAKFEESSIELTFLKNKLSPYPQRRPEFTPGLSIIDAMMFNSPRELKALIQDYVLFKKDED